MTSNDGTPLDPEPSEDERAQEMIARISRQVDLEMGRLPLVEREEAPADGNAGGEPVEPDAAEALEPTPAEAPEALAAAEPAERAEEDVSRELVERVSREVDEERRG